MIRIETLRKILQHLLNNPGEFQWNRYCSLCNLDVLDCAEHRQWLRQNGFTEVVEGKTYRTDKPVSEIYGLLEQPKPQVKAIAARSLGVDRQKVRQPQARAIKPPKLEAIAKPPKAKPLRMAKTQNRDTERFIRAKCLNYLRSITFHAASSLDVSLLIKSEIGVDCPPATVEKYISQLAGVVVCRYRSESFRRYTHTPKR